MLAASRHFTSPQKDATRKATRRSTGNLRLPAGIAASAIAAFRLAASPMASGPRATRRSRSTATRRCGWRRCRSCGCASTSCTMRRGGRGCDVRDEHHAQARTSRRTRAFSRLLRLAFVGQFDVGAGENPAHLSGSDDRPGLIRREAERPSDRRRDQGRGGVLQRGRQQVVRAAPTAGSGRCGSRPSFRRGDDPDARKWAANLEPR